MAQKIETIVATTSVTIEDHELVNFGSISRNQISPSTGKRSYWFQFGDIKHLTLVQLQVAGVGQVASLGSKGGAHVLRVSAAERSQFTKRQPSNFAGIEEYTIDRPVPVRVSVQVGA